MLNGEIINNTSSSYGGGVYIGRSVQGSSFIKNGGTIYGYTQGDNNSNRVTSGNNRGHAVYIDSSNRRESTAGPDDILDSRRNGIAGGWGF